MRRTRWLAWCVPLLLCSSFAACGKDEERPAAVTPEGGAGGAAGETATPSGASGSSVAGSASLTGGTAGAPITPQGGSGEGGEGAVANDGGSAGAGGAETKGEQLPLCARLSLKTSRAFRQSRAFAQAIYKDCRLSWLVPIGSDLDEYRQQLTIWDLEFWGCQGEPVTTFGLVWGMPELSAGDVTLLIDAYMVATEAPEAELGLSPAEYSQMKTALERLAVPYTASNSTEPSNSAACNTGGGGEGGGAGEAGGAGAAGAAFTGQGGAN